MNLNPGTIGRLALALAGLSLAGCASYVKRDEYDAAIAELRAGQQQQDSRIGKLESDMAALKRDLEQRFAKYDAAIAEMQGRVKVDVAAHFAYDDATLRDEDKPLLDDFAEVIREHHSGAMVTVEGFTDPAGSADYNKRLGQKRADAVRDYLVAQGLSADQVRAVSYGESSNRQVKSGAYGDDGMANRRVVLVVDHIAKS